MANEIIKLENVCKRYQMGDSVVEAVCHVNLDIKKGDFLALVGPSGLLPAYQASKLKPADALRYE